MTLMKTLSVLLVTSLLSISSAMAGIPTEDEMICPVGGEKFEVTNTMSCSTMGRRLSLKPITSCDFITRLPVCPTNKLPIYREFNDEELEAIETFMASETYKASLSEPDYLRAYRIAKQIEAEDSQEPFFLLQNGLWYGAGDTELDRLYQTELDLVLPKLDEPDRPFWMAAGAHQAWSKGLSERASQLLQDAKSIADNENAFLQRYLDRLDECFRGNLNSEDCSAEAEIPRK